MTDQQPALRKLGPTKPVKLVPKTPSAPAPAQKLQGIQDRLGTGDAGRINTETLGSLLSHVEDSLNEAMNRLQRLREVIVAFSNHTDQTQFQAEVDAILAEVSQILQSAECNRIKLFTGDVAFQSVEVNGRSVSLEFRIPRVDLAFLGLPDGINLSKHPYWVPLADSPEYSHSLGTFRRALERHLNGSSPQQPPFPADTTAVTLAELLNAQLPPVQHLSTAAIDSFFNGSFDPAVHVQILNHLKTDAQNIVSVQTAAERLSTIRSDALGCENRLQSAIRASQLPTETSVSGSPDLAKELMKASMLGVVENSAMQMLAQANDQQTAEALRQMLR